MDAMTTYTGRGGLATAPRVQQWFSILRSQADTSGVADLGYLEGSLLAGGEVVVTLPSEHPPEH
jgi:hypothetical protein